MWGWLQILKGEFLPFFDISNVAQTCLVGLLGAVDRLRSVETFLRSYIFFFFFVPKTNVLFHILDASCSLRIATIRFILLLN